MPGVWVRGKVEMGGKDARPARGGGLRERKKARLRHDIQVDLLRRALSDGYEAATVEGTCQAVGISKKTFFNHFASKDTALLGAPEHIPTVEELLEAFAAAGEGTCYLDVVTRELRELYHGNGEDLELCALRTRFMDEMPQYVFKGRRYMVEAQRNVTRAVRAWLEEDASRQLLPGVSAKEESLVAASTALNLARVDYFLTQKGAGERDAGALRELLMGYLSAASEK